MPCPLASYFHGYCLVHTLPQVGTLRKQAERARAETLLSLGGELSSSNCYLELQAGAGGTESHDWTSMLFKMYTRWAESRGFARESRAVRFASLFADG